MFESRRKVFEFLSQKVVNPKMNDVITLDYFCHNTIVIVSVTGSGFLRQCCLIYS